jgi:YD repeat-containing protein
MADSLMSLSATGDAAVDDYSDTYTFDLNGNQRTNTHTGPGNGASATTTNTYNGDDQLTDAVVTGGASTHYDYDPNGSRIDSKVNGTITTTYTYDVRNRMATATTSGVTSTTTYTYDQNGNETSVQSAQGTGETIHYVYDPVTNLLIETWTGTGANNTTAITDTLYGYTSLGQLESVTVVRQDSGGPTQSFTGSRYSATGGAIATTLPTAVYSYDADGNVTRIVYPNGTETEYN